MEESIGKVLPSLELEVTPGEKVRVPEDFKGKWTVLYFYPKDDTPGCTKQACSYQENIKKFRALGVEIFGVSGDGIHSHKRFMDKYGLGFSLIADTEHKLSTFLGVYGDQEWRGKVFKGLSRDSFLINPEGKVEKVWRKVNPEETVGQTYQAVQALPL